MRMQFAERGGRQASALMVTLAVVALIGLSLMAFMQLTVGQNQLTARSQVWNACMPMVEAGLEEALTHAENNYLTNMLSNGWVSHNSTFVKSNRLDEGYYLVAISHTVPYEILSQGYLPMPGSQTYVARAVKVTTAPQGLFFGALVVRESIKLNGNNIGTDSYKSNDPNKSVNGRYDPSLAGDKGDIGSVGGLEDNFTVGNANIKGKAFTGPGRNVVMGPEGAVGSTAWHDAGNNGIQPGWWQDDFSMDIPDVKAPFTTGTTASGGTVNGTNYSYVLGDGTYVSKTLSGQVLVTGNASLYVSGDVDFKTGDQLIIAPGAKLTLYVAGARTKIAEVINLNSTPDTFYYFGLPTNTRVDIIGQNSLTAAFYAPSADLTFGGGVNMYGAVVAKSATLNGGSSFHYDEALAETGPRRNVVVETWNEVKTVPASVFIPTGFNVTTTEIPVTSAPDVVASPQ